MSPKGPGPPLERRLLERELEAAGLELAETLRTQVSTASSTYAR